LKSVRGAGFTPALPGEEGDLYTEGEEYPIEPNLSVEMP
jgi:hypothetical protein